MPHPKRAAAPPTSLPPAEASYAPQPAGYEEDGALGDELIFAQAPPTSARGAPPTSARGKKSRDASGKKRVEVPPEPVEEEPPPPLAAEPPEELDEPYYEEPPEEPRTQEMEEEELEQEEVPEQLIGQDGDQNSVASDTKDSDPPDVQVEVAELQKMVNKCLKEALKGVSCAVIQNGERIPTRYFVDEQLERVSITSWNTTTRLEIVVPIAGIQDIFCVPEDGEAAFPAEAMAVLADAEKELLLMCVYQGRPNELFKFCLLMESKESRDGFMEAMRVLCVASRFNAEQSSTSSGRQSAGARPGAGGGKPMGAAPPAGGKIIDHPATSRQSVSAWFFMRSIGVKALQQTGPEQSKKCPLPELIRDGVMPYISAFGYRPSDDMHWEMLRQDANAATRPTLSIRVRQHFEAAKHTWYIVEATLRMDRPGCVPRLDWLAPRRLAHLRVHLHDRVKEILGDAYGRHFAGASFAHRLGLPGTTAQLHRWVNALADVINSRRVPPLVVATALNFLEAPNPSQSVGASNGAEDPASFQGAYM